MRGAQITDNPAVVIVRYGKRWMAVTETPFLTYFDPGTLDTLERVNLTTSKARLHLMAAHGFTLDDGSYLNLGVTRRHQRPAPTRRKRPQGRPEFTEFAPR